MAYGVQLRPATQRQLAKLRGPLSIALHGALLTLSDDPRPPGAIKLAGLPSVWRLRLRIDDQSWRVVYEVNDQEQLVRVLRIAARTEGTYRRLP
jgi:mRNA interferase RelE/StbE